jgi:hypothetical protein
MLMVLKPYSSILWHRSAKAGCHFYQCVEGKLLLSTTDSCHLCTYELKPTHIYQKIDRLLWRRLTNELPLACFYYEIIPGPFDPEMTVWDVPI